MRYAPMLAQLGSSDDLKRPWIFEPKLDGTRAIYYSDEKRMINKRNNDITHRYPEITLAVKQPCVLDGELIIYDDAGNPSFRLLQSREHLTRAYDIKRLSVEAPATFVVFDILELNGKDLTGRTLAERKKLLEHVLVPNEHVQFMVSSKDGKKLWNMVVTRGLEGLIAKDPKSVYAPGKRPSFWIKIKYLKTIDCVILGYTQEKRIISALVMGLWTSRGWRYIGRVGTGFTEHFLERLHRQFTHVSKRLADYQGTKTIHWIKPEHVCEVRFLMVSRDGMLRAPAFLRMRNDKKPKDCTEDQLEGV